MKTRSKFLIVFLMISIVAVLAAACTSSSGIKYSDIESIDVDERLKSKDFAGFPLESFDISQIVLVIKYKDVIDENGDSIPGQTITKKAEDYMLRAEDREKLTTSGTKLITLRCYGYEIDYYLKLYSEISEKYTVAFYDDDGSTMLGEVQRVPEGGNAMQPNIAGKTGYTFYGWIDMDTQKSVTLNNIRKNMKLKALYIKNDFKVGYYYVDGSNEVLIEEKEIPTGKKGEDYYPEVPLREGYTFVSWQKQSDEKFYARYEAVKYNIKFVYRKYVDGTYYDIDGDGKLEYDYKGKYDDSFTTYTLSVTDSNKEIVPPEDYLPTQLISNGQSDANDYKFSYWYSKRGEEKIIIEFPLQADPIYETTFYAFYVDMNKGSEELVYKKNIDSCIVSDYVGQGGIVVIPEKTMLGGQIYNVTGMADGVFKSAEITAFAVSSTNAYFQTIDGVLYSKDYSVLYAYPISSKKSEITLADELSEIRPYAFYGAQNLKSVNFGNKLRHIQDFAFRDCVAIETISIPANVEDIGEGAFKMSGANNLKEVSFDGTEITSIGDEAFYGLDSMTSFVLPASLYDIGDGVFYGCSSLRLIDASKNSFFTNYNGALYSSDYRTLYVYPSKYDGNVSPEIYLHENCRKVLRGAFYMANVTCVSAYSQVSLETYSIVCPSIKSFRVIGDDFAMKASSFVQAFAEFLPNIIYVKSENILTDIEKYGIKVILYDKWVGPGNYEQGYAYELTESGSGLSITAYNGILTTLNIPMTIGSYPVTEISDNAFNGNAKIIEIILPVAINKVGKQAFMNCLSLQKVIVNTDSQQGLSVGDMAFYGCRRLEEFILPTGLKIAYCGKYAFENTPIINNDNDFSIIGDVLLSYKGNSLSVTVPRTVRYIATDAFKDCGFITSISFENGSVLEYVDGYAFLNCTGLKQITFPSTIRTVENYAFYGCDYLYFVNYLTLKENVRIGSEAYYRAGDFYVENVFTQFSDSEIGALKYNVSGSDSTVEGIAFVEPAIPEITMAELFIGWYYDMYFTQRAIFPISVEPGKELTLYAYIKDKGYISDGFTFSKNPDGTFTIVEYNGEDEHVILPENYMGAAVTGIGKNAFGKSVVEITIPNTLNVSTTTYVSKILSIGLDAFVKTDWYKNISGNFIIYDNLLLAYKGNEKVVIIPDNVTVIADGVFKDNKNIEYVKIPESVHALPADLFNGCTALKQLEIGTSVMTIGERAFLGCSSLCDINFDELTGLAAIEPNALDGTGWLKLQNRDCVVINGILYKYYGEEETLHIPSGVVAIGSGAFSGKSTLVNVYFPTTLVSVLENAFENAISLNAVYIPSNEPLLTYIMDNAFRNCFNLRVLNLNNAQRLVQIGNSAFENNLALTSLILPASLAMIGEKAFKSSGVETLLFSDSSMLATIDNAAFMECRSLKNVVFGDNSMLSTIGKQAFMDCTALESFLNPTARISTIDDYAFYNCQNLSVVNVNEDAVAIIGKDAVYRLGYISAQNKNMIMFGNILVSYSGTEKIVEIPSNVTIIYDSAFEGNTNVVEIVFSNGSHLNRINDRAFFGCTSLQKIDFPESANTIGYQIADGTIWYTEQLNNNDYVIINNTLIKYNINYTRQADIPAVVTKIIKGAFDGRSVYDIKIGENINEIANEAFLGLIPATWVESGVSVSGWTLTMTGEEPPKIGYDTSLNGCLAIYLPNRDSYEKYMLQEEWRPQNDLLEIIDSYDITYEIKSREAYSIASESIHALYNAKEVETIKSTSKQYVFVGWFEDPAYQTALTYPFILTEKTTIYAKCVDYDIGSNPGKYMLEDEGNGSTITDYLDTTDKKVVVITKQANKDILSITGYLGYMEYYGTEYERYVYNIEDGKFEKYDIYGSYPDGTITYRRNTVIEELSFANNCTIELLGENCFAGLTNLTKVTIPASVKRISAEAFSDCVNLREIVFEDDISDLEIEEGAFRNCTSLQTVTIPKGVSALDNDAFDGCYNLRDIYLESETPIVLYQGAMPFEIVANMKIYIPVGKKAIYSSSWSAYSYYLVENVKSEKE